MSTQQPSFVHTHLELKLQERLDAALSFIGNIPKEDVLRSDTKYLTELVKKFVVAPPLLLDSMEADGEVREVVDITFERKTGQTNHSFFMPLEGEAHWLEEVRTQRTNVDDYPLAFLDKKRPRINIRLMLSPEDEEGALKRKLDYRASLVRKYADSVATKLIEFNKNLAEKMLAEFNQRKRAIIKAEKELENVGLPRVHNPEHEETALQIQQLLRSLGAYVTDTYSQLPSASPLDSSVSTSKDGNIPAEQLYDKVNGLIQNTKTLDEYTARIIVESADDAIKEFGNTNQEKKVELRRWKAQAEEILPPKTIEDLRKRAEGKAIEKAYPKNKRTRNALYFVIVTIILALGIVALKQMFSGKGDVEKAPSPSTVPPEMSATTTPETLVSPTPNQTPTPEPQPPNVSGTYKSKLGELWLQDNHVGDVRTLDFSIDIDLFWVCKGGLEGNAKWVSENVAEYKSPINKNSCRLTFFFSDSKVRIRESQCDYYHDSNCTFDGVYVRE